MFCTKCGAKLPNDSEFCYKCGAPCAAYISNCLNGVDRRRRKSEKSKAVSNLIRTLKKIRILKKRAELNYK